MKLPKTSLIPNHRACLLLARFLPFPNIIVDAIGILRCQQLTMQKLTKLFLIVLLTGSLMACTIAAKPETASEPEIFRVGEVEVRLYQDRERMVRNLPPLFALIEATKVGNTQIRVSGYFDPQTKTIYAINDAKTVIHEFKHYLEPDWKHGHGPERSDQHPQVSHQSRPNTRLRTQAVGANDRDHAGF